MIQEGQEISDFCHEHMAHFGLKDVEDALNLPPGSEELPDGIILGRVLMLAMQQEEVKIQREGNRRYWTSLEERKQYVERKQNVRQAAKSFVSLDKRLQGKEKVQFYCRWEEHEEHGSKKRHRVYGIRQAYAAIEFEKCFGRWLEVEGRFDKAASTCILREWHDRITTTYEVERTAEAQHTLKMFGSVCSLLLAAQQGEEAAAWIRPHVGSAVAALLKGLSKETFMFRTDAGLYSGGTEYEETVKVIEGAVEKMYACGLQVDGLQDGLWEVLRDLATDRCDPLRLLGFRLLTQYMGEREATQQLFQQFLECDWPHVQEKARAALEQCRAAPQGNGEHDLATSDRFDCTSPRSLYVGGMTRNPVPVNRVRLGGRRMRRGARQDCHHVLYIVREDEDDEDEDEEE
mmetsp:Transcript_51577/g.120287  ORF Transcript_51577/g.120287 Transcript_51577/m.120287 type:complete len:403 (-) Transcript_51577:307-1515(-)